MNHESLTVIEAIDELTKATGKQWTANKLLAVLIRFNGAVEAELDNSYAVFSQRYDAANQLVDEQITTSSIAKLGERNIIDLIKGGTKAYFAKHHNEIQFSPPPIIGNVLLPDSPSDADDIPFLECNEFIEPVPVTMGLLRVPVNFVEQLKQNKEMWAAGLPDENVETVILAPPAPFSIEHPEPTATAEAKQTALPVNIAEVQAPQGNRVNLTIYPPLESVSTTTVPTAAAAFYLNRAVQTLRGWAAYENGALKPIRINNRLAWSVSEIRKLVNVAVK